MPATPVISTQLMPTMPRTAKCELGHVATKDTPAQGWIFFGLPIPYAHTLTPAAT